MGQIRTELPGGDRSGHRVAVDACGALKDAPPFRDIGLLARG